MHVVERLEDLLTLWAPDQPNKSPLGVDQIGAIFIARNGGYVDLRGNHALPHENRFGLLGPFEYDGHKGPDLVQPREHLRIVPDRVAGEPHVENTRLTSQTLAGLAGRGLDVGRIARMYGITENVVAEAIDLETDLHVA